MDQPIYIQTFAIKNLWGRFSIEWENIASDVNILVGINGCGKTTFLNSIYNYYTTSSNKSPLNCEGNKINIPLYFIRSFDVLANSKRKKETPLLQALLDVILQNKNTKKTFFDYRMRMLNYPEEATLIEERINKFFGVVNDLFAETGKVLEIDKDSNRLVFKIENKNGAYQIGMEQLSSGEKQMLLILLTVFLQEEQPCVLLMDEPEISLHITWQDKLISTIRELNPQGQLILTTHSPSIFANGWEDKLVFLENLERDA